MLKNAVDAARSVANNLIHGKPPTGSAPASIADIPLVRLDGAPLPHAELEGKAVLFVNVASKCGLTPQYAQLVDLDKRYRDRGLRVVGVPCNQFMGQEPGTAGEIQSFCAMKYGVDFPLLEKQDVNGSGRSPLYQHLVESEPGGGKDITWNFEKFLVGRDGRVVARFSPKTLPDAPEVVSAIESALA